MSEMTIEVQPREEHGKNASRRLRAAGRIPAVVYGAGLEPAAIHVGERKIQELLRQGMGENTVFLLKLSDSGKSRHTIIRDMQLDATNGQMIHIDFQRVKMDEEVRVTVPVEIHGVPYGVKTDGGMLDFITRELEISCLPGSIPAHLDLDVTELHVGQHVEAKDLEIPEGVTLLDEPERVIVSIAGKQAAEEEVDEEGEGLLSATEDEPTLVGE